MKPTGLMTKWAIQHRTEHERKEKQVTAKTRKVLASVPMAYLKKGDRFVATKGGRAIAGIADMDGHQVSEVYGTRTGNHYYDQYDRNYINVKLDGEVYVHPGRNETIYEAEGYTFHVVQAIFDRVQQDNAENANREMAAENARIEAAANSIEKNRTERKKQEILAQIEVLRKQAEAL